jgi:hypothetical protein
MLTLKGNMYIRSADDRRNAKPFGKKGPWLTRGKMGGLIFTDRRKGERRSSDRNSIVQIDDLKLCYS